MSNLPWFKLYTEARTDKKLGLLTRAEKGVWIDLLCYAGEQEERGVFDASDRMMLAVECADGDVDLLDSTLQKLLNVRHIVPCGLYETSETSGNEDVTTGNSLQRYIFRTFAARQAQKVSHFPSDDKDKVNARVRKHRALKRQAKASHDDTKSVTSETRRNDTDREREREREREETVGDLFSSSGKVSYKAAVVAPAAPTTAALNGHSSQNHWDDVSAKRTAEEVARRVRLRSQEIPALMNYIKACPMLSHELILGEAESFVAWLNKSHKAADARVFYNRWLKPANQEAQQQRHSQEKSMSNGHYTTGSHGSGPASATYSTTEAKPPSDFEQRYQANLAARPTVVQRGNGRAATG